MCRLFASLPCKLLQIFSARKTPNHFIAHTVYTVKYNMHTVLTMCCHYLLSCAAIPVTYSSIRVSSKHNKSHYIYLQWPAVTLLRNMFLTVVFNGMPQVSDVCCKFSYYLKSFYFWTLYYTYSTNIETLRWY